MLFIFPYVKFVLAFLHVSFYVQLTSNFRITSLWYFVASGSFMGTLMTLDVFMPANVFVSLLSHTNAISFFSCALVSYSC